MNRLKKKQNIYLDLMFHILTILSLRYPMALGNLGDLEEISPSPGRPPPINLFEESIEANKKHYNNRHVYPYTYLGAYQYRNMNYKEALQAWADAASVVKTYGSLFLHAYKFFNKISSPANIYDLKPMLYISW